MRLLILNRIIARLGYVKYIMIWTDCNKSLSSLLKFTFIQSKRNKAKSTYISQSFIDYDVNKLVIESIVLLKKLSNTNIYIHIF